MKGAGWSRAYGKKSAENRLHERLLGADARLSGCFV